MEIYKDYKIEYYDFGYYEATKLTDCDAVVKNAKTIEELKKEIDEEQEEEKFDTLFNFFMWFRQHGDKYVNGSVEEMINIYLDQL